MQIANLIVSENGVPLVVSKIDISVKELESILDKKAKRNIINDCQPQYKDFE